MIFTIIWRALLNIWISCNIFFSEGCINSKFSNLNLIISDQVKVIFNLQIFYIWNITKYSHTHYTWVKQSLLNWLKYYQYCYRLKKSIDWTQIAYIRFIFLFVIHSNILIVNLISLKCDPKQGDWLFWLNYTRILKITQFFFYSFC